MPKEAVKPHYLVCNADESEPGTFKDREIMRWTPARADRRAAPSPPTRSGRSAATSTSAASSPSPGRIMSAAVDEAFANGALGDNVFGSGKRIDMVLHRGAGAYICGEETAMMNSIEGKRGNPRIKPPFPGGRRRLRDADHDQQCGDPRRRAAHPHPRGGVVQGSLPRQSQEHRHQAGLGLRPHPAARELRGDHGHADAGHPLRHVRRPAARTHVQGGHSGRLLGADHEHGGGRGRRCSTTRASWRRARCSARPA